MALCSSAGRLSSWAAPLFTSILLGCEKHHSRLQRYSQSLIFSAPKCAKLTDAMRSRCELANKSASSLILALRCDSPRWVLSLELIDVNHHLRKKQKKPSKKLRKPPFYIEERRTRSRDLWDFCRGDEISRSIVHLCVKDLITGWHISLLNTRWLSL